MAVTQNLKFNILSLKCLKERGEKKALTNNQGKLEIKDLKENDSSQQWTLVPNLVIKDVGQRAGYTILNGNEVVSAKKPRNDKQIDLVPSSNPFYEGDFCWSLNSAGRFGAESLWAIQSFKDSLAMDVTKGNCNNGSKVVFYGWNDADNQKWILRKID